MSQRGQDADQGFDAVQLLHPLRRISQVGGFAGMLGQRVEGRPRLLERPNNIQATFMRNSSLLIHSRRFIHRSPNGT